ncbi:MAG: membrane dipeptidase, partial [Balneolaceae bacterium]
MYSSTKTISSTLLLVFWILPLYSCTTIAQTAEEAREPFREQAVRILEEVPLIDGHNDTPWQYRGRADYKFSVIDFMNTTELDPPMHTDIPRLRDGGVGGQFWSVYVPASLPESEAVQAT